MNELTKKNSSPILAVGGAGFLALAAIFLVRDLALPPETLMGVAALLAAITALVGRRWPAVGPAALLGVAAVGGAWYTAVKSPVLLPALVLTALASGVTVVMHERRAAATPQASTLPGQLAWYAAGAAFLVASGALYFHFLTLGVASESLVRRLIPTIAWLAKNAIRTDGSISRNATTANTPVLAQSTGRRFGTAVKLARIIPVEYSPVITSTPRTAMASCETLTPARAMSSGCRSARSCGLIEPQ